MASKRRGKGDGEERSIAAVGADAVLGSKAFTVAALEGAKRKPKPKPKPRRKPKPKPRKTTPPKRRARRIPSRARKSAAEVEATVAARPAAPAATKPTKADRAARKRAQQLVAQIEKRKQRVARDFYAMGKALEALSRRRMYRALGYGSFEELLAGQQLVSRTAAFKLIAVAKTYPKQQALELGLEKAYGVIRWSRASGSERSPSELVTGDVLIGNRRIRDITVRALEDQARRAEAGSPPKPQTRARREAERVARVMQREMRAQGLGDATASARRIRGRWHVTVDVLASDAAAWLEAEGG